MAAAITNFEDRGLSLFQVYGLLVEMETKTLTPDDVVILSIIATAWERHSNDPSERNNYLDNNIPDDLAVSLHGILTALIQYGSVAIDPTVDTFATPGDFNGLYNTVITVLHAVRPTEKGITLLQQEKLKVFPHGYRNN